MHAPFAALVERNVRLSAKIYKDARCALINRCNVYSGNSRLRRNI
jgi:hypothetical protein